MDLTLKGKNAIVTGGSSNIGRSIVSTLAQEGANIVVFDIDVSSATKVIEFVKSEGAIGDLSVKETDITNASNVNNSIEEVIEKFG